MTKHTITLKPFCSPMRAVAAEGARIGLANCNICGATLLIDPDEPGMIDLHRNWHLSHGEKI